VFAEFKPNGDNLNNVRCEWNIQEEKEELSERNKSLKQTVRTKISIYTEA
jgi:hypothetical protein